jgi:uncharacterized protein DUF5650/dockerin type I repeat protein
MKTSAFTNALPALAACLFFCDNTLAATQTDIIGPAGSVVFGQSVKVLPNGNFVVSDPQYNAPGPIAAVGRVYLYNRSTLALINTITGTAANDFIGGSGVTVLANGDYVVGSSSWNNGTGAVTRCSATSGCPATISAANSLVGSATTHGVGAGVTALPSGNYVVQSPNWDNAATSTADVGAVTWCNGAATCVGPVSTANSLVGSTAGDQVGAYLVYILSNGNYVVQSSLWNNGAATFAGALTRCSGTAVCTGTVSPANSLVGSTTNDSIGSYGITPLTNGGYVVNSPQWDNGGTVDAGAATFCNAASGCTGIISAANSLIGSINNDQVGLTSIALTNGNYVVGSLYWDNGGIMDAGAVTFGNGTTGRVGAITPANSLVGTTALDQVGGFGATALSNGNYVVGSSQWDNPVGPIPNAGAATWCSGTSGCSGPVTAANSLTGPSVGDSVGGATALANGNYLVSSPYWDNHAPFAADAGAVTFCGSAFGCVGTVTSANSLIGSTAGDNVGNNNNIVLSNGNYVVLTPSWNNGPTADVGAATFCSGTTGCSGTISPGNSLIGSAQADQVGTLGVASTGGNYLVLSPNWKNGGTSRAGAITRGGPSGITGTVTPANSLVGSTMDDAIGGFGETTALPNGDYIVRSTDWDNAGIVDAGAISYGLGNGGTVGSISAANSVRGLIQGGGSSQNFAVGSSNNDLVVGRPSENIVTVFKQSGIAFSAVSRKVHGVTPFDINLPPSPNTGVECRIGGATNDFRVVFTFPNTVTFNSASVSSGTGSVSSSSGGGTATVTVDLTGVTNAQVITVTLTNVHSGSVNADVTVPMGVLFGDTNGNGSVNSTDVSQTKLKSGQGVDVTNFRTDVNVSNSINATDVSSVKLRVGTALP